MSVDEAFNHRREATPNSRFSCCLLGIQAGAEHTGVYLKYYMEDVVHILWCSRNRRLSDCMPVNVTEMNKRVSLTPMKERRFKYSS